jgi:hypothetical protein
MEKFLIDPNRPYVYLKFDHTGKGIPRSESEPTSRIWLRLVNNCHVPIIVSTFGIPKGSPKYEAGVMDKVVPVAASELVTIGQLPMAPLPPPFGPAAPEPKPSTKAMVDEMPSGYMFDVGSFSIIPPGKAILFSVPASHLSERWDFEIPFRFDLPKCRGRYDPTIGGQPHMTITYSISDIPSEYRTEFDQK